MRAPADRRAATAFFNLLLILSLIEHAVANVEKIIFSQDTLNNLPSPTAHFAASLSDLKSLEAGASLVPEHIVAFPRNSTLVRESNSPSSATAVYYRLSTLSHPHSSYEIRVCWPATFPTDWSLDLFRLDDTAVVVRVLAVESGIAYAGSGGGHSRAMPYAIALDRLIFHAIPLSTLPVGSVIAIVIGMSLAFLLPAVQMDLALGGHLKTS
ncbi:hypothetical protein HDU90_005767 [Geranomyces variabilis]|nr:hypothetical protein HDU90_005767 [Geranomyces variabilis]